MNTRQQTEPADAGEGGGLAEVTPGPAPQQAARARSLAAKSGSLDEATLLDETQPIEDAEGVPAASTGPAASHEREAPPAISDGQGVEAGSHVKHYELLRPLGRGGMGTVFLARDTKLGRLVAVKVLLKHSEENVQRFLSEARATARCRHENIVVIHEVDEVDGSPYMVLEHLEGRTLRDWLGRLARVGAVDPLHVEDAATERVSPGLAVELMLPVVRALACAHAHGIVHRDLKPANIVLTDAGPVKVLDFGIAKRLGAGELSALASPDGPPSLRPELTRPGALMGTLPYMAPEQWRGDEVDPRTDLWAVGIILFRLVAGAHPLAPISWVLQLATVGDFTVPMPSVYETCPDLGPLGSIIDRCLKKPKAERFGSADELLSALEALSRDGVPPAADSDESPFAGLSAFQEADAARFFGRENEIAAAVGRLQSQPLVTVSGPSGAGKSSFVRAGLIPAMKRAREATEALIVRPGRRPLSALADVLAPHVAAGEADGLVDILRVEPGFLGARLRERCRGRAGRHVVLFVDQFEELYTLGAGPEERAAFLACLASVADDASSPLRVVLALRSDFLDRAAEDRPFGAELTRGLVLLPSMGPEGLGRALTRPVEAAGYHFENEALVERMLSALEGTRCPLPLLQFAAAALFRARDRKRKLLTHESYDELGGVAGALSTHADAVLAGLAPFDQRLCRALFLRLVTPERTRAVVSSGELGALDPEGGAVDQIVQRLADARLVVVEPSGDGEGSTVELVHESLIDRWPRLGQWLDESAHDAKFLARLRAAAREWQASGEAEGLLWRDRPAEEARDWLERRRAEAARAGGAGGGALSGLGEGEGRYLRAVVALVDRSRRLRRRVAAGLFSALAAVALVVSLLALQAKNEAARARSEAERADQETAKVRAEAARADRQAALARDASRMTTARELQTSDPTAALSLLREIESPEPPRGWKDLAYFTSHGDLSSVVFFYPPGISSRSVAFTPDGRRVVTTATDGAVRAWNADGSGEPHILRWDKDALFTIEFSPDGRRALSIIKNKHRANTMRIWNVDGSGEPLVLKGHEGRISAARWSPDGQHVASSAHDNTIRVWNADGSGEPLVLRGHDDVVFGVSWSPDGKRLASASQDRTVRVWSADGSGAPIVVRGHESAVFSASFSPDGGRIVSASDDRTARVWVVNKAGGVERKPLVLRGHEFGVSFATFSPDGRRVLTASVDKTARVWHADGSGEPLVLRGHENQLFMALFSPDGKRVATMAADQTVRVWEVDEAKKPLILWKGEAYIAAAELSPDGRRIAVIVSDDGALRILNADGSGKPLVLRGHRRDITGISWSPDGQRILTASLDKTARIWNADGSGEPLVLRGHEDEMRGAAFSPDGLRVATTSRDRTVRIWNADGSGEPLVFRHESMVLSVGFSPDGRRIASGTVDRKVYVWSADGSGEPLVLRGHTLPVNSTQFSHDGKKIVSAAQDNTMRVWNADGSGEALTLLGHEDNVNQAAFSLDDKSIISSSADKTVRVWQADGSGEPLVLRGHTDDVSSASFSPDGKRIITASVDKTLRAWSDFTPVLGVDDPKLWAATTYCLPAERRVDLLHTPEHEARADQRACERRVKAAQAAAGLR